MAASENDCASLFQKNDINLDNYIGKEENLDALAAAAQKGNATLANPARMSREEFLSYCKAGAFSVTSSPPSSRERTAGDATPSNAALVAGANSFTEEQARSHIEDKGYADVGRLNQDTNGIWRGAAKSDGRAVNVGLDYQGNVISN